MSANFGSLNAQFKKCTLPVAFLFLLAQSAGSSHGDRSEIYRRCVHWCGANNCSNSTTLAHFKQLQPWYLSVLQWECWDECEYTCMWRTVKVFQFSGQPVPQFHGKWPFLRFFGIQEPASVLFSVLNGLTHYVMWQKFRRTIPRSSSVNVWNVHGLLSINAWFWSAIFHTRDTPVTEKLDYYCAFSLVLYSFYCLSLKIVGRNSSWLPIALAVPFLTYFIYHIHYLTFIRFDYGYNLKANVSVGMLNSLGWLLWCYKNRHKMYVWKCAMTVVMINALLLLELGDFPPWGFMIDAHALWHLGTIPVPFLWYSFLIEDSLYEFKWEKLKEK